MSVAGPRYLSLFHQYEGQLVEQQAQRIHSYRPSSFARSSFVCGISVPLHTATPCGYLEHRGELSNAV